MSTEQILFPERYLAGDRPLDVRFADSLPGAFEDVLGEFETRLLAQELPDGWDSEMQCYPHVFWCGDTAFLLYNGNAFGRGGFGGAVLEK